MYCLNEQQIDFILNDIRARGVETESLQLNLLDHCCCIIEQELKENGDFEPFYLEVISRFYKVKLSEIEEETHLLLTNKNYYVMKKVMISSGVFSATALATGIILKYLHANGASVLLTLGIGTVSLIFLPLLVKLKIKEQQKGRDKVLLLLGALSAIMISLAILFKVQHWPGANVMGVLSPAVLGLVFLPIYFFSGFGNPETRVNTIVTSVLIIVGCCLFFTLTITPKSSQLMAVRNTVSYMRSEQILKDEQSLQCDSPGAATGELARLTTQINEGCATLKKELVGYATGAPQAQEGDLNKTVFIKDATAQDYFSEHPATDSQLAALAKAIGAYNAALSGPGLKKIPESYTVINQAEDKAQEKVTVALSDLIQVQMILLQNQRLMVQNKLAVAK